jgi:hypothetical protein
MAAKTLMLTCKEYFGLKPGQSLNQFGEEMKQLTPQDKADLIELFKVVGIEVLTDNKK